VAFGFSAGTCETDFDIALSAMPARVSVYNHQGKLVSR
jgi:hypothetical protein